MKWKQNTNFRDRINQRNFHCILLSSEKGSIENATDYLRRTLKGKSIDKMLVRSKTKADFINSHPRIYKDSHFKCTKQMQ